MRQDRHVTLINRESGTSENLAAAKKAKFDEFYTPLEDIKIELNHYKDKFKGKRIICPCDWDVIKDEDVYAVTIEFGEEAIIPTWITNRVQRVVLKHRRYAFDPADSIPNDNTFTEVEEVLTGEQARELLGKRVTCNFINYLLSIANECKIKSITASGYDGVNKRGVKFQEVDYSCYDLCLTNPPFSLYKEFMECMMTEYSKRNRITNPFDFIVLAPLINRVAPSVCEPLMEQKIFLGYTRDTHVIFRNPDETATHAKKKSVDIDWLTTFNDAQREVDRYLISTGVKYDIYKTDYVSMPNITCKDGTHPIKINDKRVIPEDYCGWMLCSSGVLNKLSFKYYEWYMLSLKGYFNKRHPDKNPLAHPVTDSMFDGGFNGQVLFRRKPNVPYEEDN